MKILIIGMGEVGSAIAKLAEKKHTVTKLDRESYSKQTGFDVMHICFPWSRGFVYLADEYIRRYEPKLTIIESTVEIGTTRKIAKLSKRPIAHSPVRGKHPDIYGGLLKYAKMVGGMDRNSKRAAMKYYLGLGVKVKGFEKPETTELGKILSTTYYMSMITWHQEMWRICQHFGVNFDEAVTQFSETCTIDPEGKIPRPTYYVDFNGIGGHCLVPNMALLRRHYNSKYLEAMVESNKKIKRGE